MQPIQIHPRGDNVTVGITSIPADAVNALRLRRVHQDLHFLAKNVVDDQLDLGRLRERIPDGRGGIEGGGVILVQPELRARIRFVRPFVTKLASAILVATVDAGS